MADRGPLLKWSPDTWTRWGAMARMSLTAIQRTKFLLLKAPLSTAYEEKYGDRNVFTVSMYVQRLIAKGIAVGLVIDCTALDLVLYDKTTSINTNGKNGTTFYFHNSMEWEDFGIDYYRLRQAESDAGAEAKADKPKLDQKNVHKTHTIAPTTIQEFIKVCAQHWKDNPTLHIAIYDSRGGLGAAAFLAAYWLCLKLKAPVHTALAILEKASPVTSASNADQKGLLCADMISMLQESFSGKKEIILDYSKFPRWWFAQGEPSTGFITIPVSASPVKVKAKAKRPHEEGSDGSQKVSKRVRDGADDSSIVPLQLLAPDSNRYRRATTVLKELTGSNNSFLCAESNLTTENIVRLQIAKHKVTWESVGRRGLLLVLSDGTFFLENDNENGGGEMKKVSIVTCPLYIPNPQKPSTCQHRTLLDVTLVMDRENGTLISRFLVSDILVHMGSILMKKPFSLRSKYVIDGIILARKKSVNIWNYSKERIRMRAKEYFGLKETDFVCKQVMKAQLHGTDGLRFVSREGLYKQSNDGDGDGDEVLLCKSDNEGMIEKVLTHIATL